MIATQGTRTAGAAVRGTGSGLLFSLVNALKSLEEFFALGAGFDSLPLLFGEV
jgi:hypothetical protein